MYFVILNFIFVCICLCVHACVYVHVLAGTHEYVCCECGDKNSMLSVFLNYSLFFETGSLIEPRAS